MSNKYEILNDPNIRTNTPSTFYTENEIPSCKPLIKKKALNQKIGRILLKPGFWAHPSDPTKDSKGIYEKTARTLHLGHLGNLYKSYDLIGEDGVCIALIDDIRKPEQDPIADQILAEFIEDLEWLNLPKLKIVTINQELSKIRTFLYELIMQDRVFIQVFSLEDGSEESSTGYPSNTNNEEGHVVNTESYIPSFINDVQRVKSIFFKILLGKPLNIDASTIKFRLKLPEARNPLLLQVKNGCEPQISLNFAIIIIDLIYGVNFILEEMRNKPFSNEVQIFYQWTFNYFKRELPRKLRNCSYKIHNFKYYRDKIQGLIDINFFDQWDDPRLLTIAGVRRRGITPEIVHNFCHKANRIPKVNIGLLDVCAKEYFDHHKNLPRIVAILEPVPIKISNLGPNETEFILPPNKSFQKENLIPFSNQIYVEKSDISRLREGFTVMLKNGFTIHIEKRVYNDRGSLIEIIAKYIPESIMGTGSSDPSFHLSQLKESIPWLSYEAGERPIEVDFCLYSKWYLSGFPNRNKLSQDLNVPIYRGLVSRKIVGGNESPDQSNIVFINRLGFFKEDTETTNMLRLNLITSLPKVEKILQNSNWKSSHGF